jgi:Tn3 transposase DDE domain/Domain of unknown function (DUF4158)
MTSQGANSTQKRLNILSDDEIEALYGRPRFTYEEQLQYFTLSPTEKAPLQELRSVHSRAYFILQLGYFKAKHLFFIFEFHEVKDDLQFILEQHFPDTPIDDLSTINKRTNLRQRRLILDRCSYPICGIRERQKLEEKARFAASVSSKPIYVFGELMHMLTEQRIVAPGYSNTTQVQPQVHSTDTHGTNEVNFALLHFFGYQFAPRYQDIYDKVTKSLYGFQHPGQYGDLLIKPIRKVNTNLILDEWENFQRIMLSLTLKTTTQRIIVGKLSAYPRKNKTKRALWEYDNIIRSLYLLDYIDSPSLRQNVQRALNRGENYHQLRRAVSYANFGKLRFKTEYEQQIWNEGSRLIANCIIHYNATILSTLLKRKEKSADAQAAALLKQISPVAWQHINLQGRYEFGKQPGEINIDAIIQSLGHSLIPFIGSIS